MIVHAERVGAAEVHRESRRRAHLELAGRSPDHGVDHTLIKSQAVGERVGSGPTQSRVGFDLQLANARNVHDGTGTDIGFELIAYLQARRLANRVPRHRR